MPAKKVYSLPTPSQAAKDSTNAINQVVLRLQHHLPTFGWEITEDRAAADLFAGHAGQTHESGTRVDVAHCHGLYPTAEHAEQKWHFGANTHVLKNLLDARAVTAPSQWVADILRRDLSLDPTVVGWAIDRGVWKREPHRGYTLWNKTRQSAVCDPTPIEFLAGQFKRDQFISTFGQGAQNLDIIGRQVYETMQEIVQHAMVYLATTKETFGIGTLEAMACGIPILGYRWGGTADMVEHGHTGYLVEPGDLDGLLEGYRYCVENRSVLGYNARRVALEYTWDKVAERFAEVYEGVVTPLNRPFKVAVIIPSYNYGHYVGEAVYSALQQKTEFDYEVLVVDPGSTDNTPDVLTAIQHDTETPRNARAHLRTVRIDRTGPASARNYGIAHTDSEYIVCLDADDRLGHEQFLQRLAASLDETPEVGLVFTGLALMAADGIRLRPSDWPDGMDFAAHLKGKNQVPTCNMFRRTAFERAGGYRHYLEPAEDAELWLRFGALGYQMRQITTEAWFCYRWHDQSLSAPVRQNAAMEPKWRHYHPWVEGGAIPAGCILPARNGSHPVRNYDRPLISVIIPVGPGHVAYLSDALDSVHGQSEWRWECVVVNDSGQSINLRAYPWVKEIDTGGGKGAGAARNIGATHAQGQLLAFLDADDMFHADFLSETLMAYRQTGRYIYTDWISVSKAGKHETHQTPEYEPNEVFKRTSIHSINILIEREAFWQVGGFDEQMISWEDVEFFMKLAKAGICGQRVPRALTIYRYLTGSLREQGETIKAGLKQMLYQRYQAYIDPGGEMCKCNNGPKMKATDLTALNGDMVRIVYRGAAAKATVVGTATRTNYQRRADGDVFMVWAADVIATPDRFVPIDDPIERVAATIKPPPPRKVLA